jgi:hypothetical protein
MSDQLLKALRTPYPVSRRGNSQETGPAWRDRLSLDLGCTGCARSREAPMSTRSANASTRRWRDLRALKLKTHPAARSWARTGRTTGRSFTVNICSQPRPASTTTPSPMTGGARRSLPSVGIEASIGSCAGTKACRSIERHVSFASHVVVIERDQMIEVQCHDA